MLVKSFCLVGAGAVALVGAVAWSGCSGGTTAVPASDPDAGGSSGTSGGTSGGTTPDTDSGPGQGGPDAGPPLGVSISYGTCAAFTKCGGVAVGSWKLSGGCLSQDTFAGSKENCPGLKESNVDIHASGTIDVVGTSLKRKSQIEVSAHVQLPKSCFNGYPCSLVETGLTTIGSGGIKFDRAKCTENGALCECDVGSTYNDDIDTTYTTTPEGTLTTAPSGSVPQRTYDYCTAADSKKMTFTETTAGQPLKLFVEITK